jgi:purine-nucleoside phosphorylase
MSQPESTEQIHKFLTENGFPDQVNSIVILGSGLGDFTSVLDEPESIPYSHIPGFPDTSVEGHSGELFWGTVMGRAVLAFSGRFHHYEGYPFSRTVLPVHIASAFKARQIIISNAAGAINTKFKVGELMVIDDIFRLFHTISASPGEPFRYNLYPVADRVRKIAADIGLEVQRGSYLYVKGPNYETKAEIQAFRKMGADVVGMSTAPELGEASRLNIPAAAISLITNMAAGVLKKKLDHSEVKTAAEKRKEDFARLVVALIERL